MSMPAAVSLAVLASSLASVPFKLGTFEAQGKTFVGLVRADQAVVEVAGVADMRDLIARYDELRAALNALAQEPRPSGARVHALKAVKLRPPIPNPETMLNAAVNYTEHEAEMQGRPAAAAPPPASLPRSAPGLWERRPDDVRQNPYLFAKPRTALIGDGETIRIPPGRDQIDWECELAVVIGRRASRVPAERAAEHVFGYTLENDVSDRGGRGDSRHGSDWLVGKAHDTFAPLGPFIVPKEFVPDPHKLAIKFSLSGKPMQDSSTERMTHSVYEMLQYASNILTLQPGDVISTGSPAGVGSARNPPIFMKPGDVAECTIEGIGTLTNPVAAAEPGR
ncbi:MAG TPA: fumarylacetoacetate hydrolase family protein [Vicinamibacteria bacterium]|nr:fumarylacetoacetate hydrolase family protein [Vicinamibacteria bacterium]